MVKNNEGLWGKNWLHQRRIYGSTPPPDTHQTQVQNVTLEPVRDNPKAVPGSFSAKTLFYNQITHTLKNALQTQSIKFPQ